MHIDMNMHIRVYIYIYIYMYRSYNEFSRSGTLKSDCSQSSIPLSEPGSPTGTTPSLTGSIMRRYVYMY
jgi:hypothetical protein